MNRNRLVASRLVLALMLSGVTAPVAGAEEPTRTIATYPSGTFLENLAQGSDGEIVVTSYFDRTLLRWSGQEAPSVLAALDVHPVGVLVREADIVLTAHGASFADGPAFTQTNAFVLLDREGGILRTIPVPDARFLNGLVEVAPGIVLAADSLAGRIWRLHVEGSDVSVWLEDPLLTTDPAANDQSPGANGLKIRDGMLYVSNSSRRALYRVALDGSKAAGALELFAETGSIDDFAFLADGSIAAASHGAAVIRIARDGPVSTLLDSGCDACTAVLPVAPGNELLVLTTGNLLDGGSAPARILALPAPRSD
jgi:hypothetical protein